MVIVEGPDGAGKTTLVQTISEALGVPVAKKIVASDASTILENKHDWVERNLAEGRQRTLFDRHCLISEGIYGPILRGTLPEEFQDWDWYVNAQRRLRALNPLVIFCLPPLGVVANNIAGDEVNPDTVVSAIEPIYWSYWHAAMSWPNPIRWNYDEFGSPAGLSRGRGMLIAMVDRWLRRNVG